MQGVVFHLIGDIPPESVGDPEISGVSDAIGAISSSTA